MLKITHLDGQTTELPSINEIEQARQYWTRKARITWLSVHLNDDLLWMRPPRGYYAYQNRRYFVKEGTGKWNGWRFLQTGSDYHDRQTIAMLRPDTRIVKASDHAKEVFHAICRNPQERAAEWGLITGKCGICGRRLENPESRALGIGPVCASRLS